MEKEVGGEHGKENVVEEGEEKEEGKGEVALGAPFSHQLWALNGAT